MKRSSALLALSALALPHRAGAQTLAKLTLVSTAGTAPGPAVYAEKVGLFRKYGLDVVHTQMSSGAAIVAAVVGGSADIGSGSSFSVVTAYAHGIAMQMFAAGPVFNASEAIPYGMILVGKNAPFKTAADLNGKTFGLAIARGDLNATATQAWIEQHGGDWSSIKVLEIPQTAMVAALEAGRIDAMTLQSPNATVALETGKVRLFGKPYDAVAPMFMIAPWWGLAAYAAKNPDVVHRFAQAMAEASRYANAHPQEMLPLLSAYSGVDQSVLEHAARAPFGDHLDPAEFQPVIDLQVKYKIIDKGFDAKEILAPSAMGRL
jgi:NitT/TauT family transport system substrate-binding protein